MSESADITRRFNNAVRAYTPPPPPRHAKLMPLKEGIIELRQKGASIRLIRELLATVGVAVGTYTITRFLAEVTGESEPRSRTKQTRFTRRSERRSLPVRSIAEPTANEPTPLVQKQPEAAASPPGSDRTRTRGPRIADPRNL
jgi:hypothetical protein